MIFERFWKELFSKGGEKVEIKIKGKWRRIKGMARFTTINYAGDEYAKLVFDDHSFMLILPGEKEIYFAEKVLGRARGISDEEIGKKKILEYQGKKYQLGNKDDYQYCLQVYMGKAGKDVEGECRFSDYFPVTGPKEFLSLGWFSDSGERADIHCRIIDIKDISIKSIKV